MFINGGSDSEESDGGRPAPPPPPPPPPEDTSSFFWGKKRKFKAQAPMIMCREESGTKQKDEMCKACNTAKKIKGSAYCKVHKQSHAAMRANSKESGQEDHFDELMQDDEVASKMILDFTAKYPGGKPGKKRCAKIDWFRIAQTYGSRSAVTSRCKVKKMDWEEFCCYFKNKRGWDKEKSHKYWLELEADPAIKRDMSGAQCQRSIVHDRKPAKNKYSSQAT